MAAPRFTAVVDTTTLRAPTGERGARTSARAARVRRLLAAADTSAVLCALAAAFWVTGRDDWAEALAWALLFTPAWILLFKVYGLYDRDERRITHSTIDDAPWAFHALLVGALGIWLLLKITPPGHLVLVAALVFLNAALSVTLAAATWVRLTRNPAPSDSPTGIPARKAVRLAASSGASPRMRRFRYVERVGSSAVEAGLAGAVVVSVADPDTAAEAAAMTGHAEPARDDRPGP